MVYDRSAKGACGTCMRCGLQWSLCSVLFENKCQLISGRDWDELNDESNGHAVSLLFSRTTANIRIYLSVWLRLFYFSRFFCSRIISMCPRNKWPALRGVHTTRTIIVLQYTQVSMNVGFGIRLFTLQKSRPQVGSIGYLTSKGPCWYRFHIKRYYLLDINYFQHFRLDGTATI